MPPEIQHHPATAPGEDERWQRFPDDDEDGVRGVEVIRDTDSETWAWSVIVSVMEFVREDPLESELRAAIAAGLRTVPGATKVKEDDRESWLVNGTPAGEQLARAVAEVVDRFAERSRAYVEGV
jgi:hypothetical protein